MGLPEVGKELKLIITDEYKTYTIIGTLVQMGVQTTNDISSVDLEIRGRELEFQLTEDFIRTVTQNRVADCWECDYCGSVNPMKYRYCGGGEGWGCNKTRSFLLR